MEVPRLFDTHVAVVSGAAQGLGEAFARALASAGCAVALLDVRLHGVEAVAASLRESGARCLALAVDVGDENACRRAIDQVSEALGPVGVLVNNAGVGAPEQLEDPGLGQAIDRAMAVNLKGVLNLTRACLPGLKQNRGTIVNVASIAGLVATTASVAYGATKGAVVQATKFLARDLAPFGIRVNALAPGFVLTPLTADLREGSESRMQRLVARTMLKRAAEPDDLVGPMLFLASDLSRYVTGIVLPVDGGYTAQ